MMKAKISRFLSKKSPKANAIRAKVGNRTEEQEGREQESTTTNKSIQGAQSPLLGDKGGSQSHPSDDTGAQQPPSAPVGVLEERGRDSSKVAAKKRTKLVLEKWAQVHSKKAEESTRKPRQKRKAKPEDNPQGSRLRNLKEMFEQMGNAQSKESKDRKQKPEPEEGN